MSILIFIPLTLIAAIAERPKRYPAYRKRINHFETTKKARRCSRPTNR